MAGLSKPGREVSRERVLTDAELAAVWRAAEDGPFGCIVRLLILTAARLDQIGRLRWSEIEGDTIHLEGSRTKNGKPHLIPLSPQAMGLLRNTPRIGDEYVFTFDGAKPVTSWSRAKARLDQACGVKDWHIHDIRRTVATGMQKLGVALQTVEALLGHTSGSRAGIVGVYQRHDFAAEKRVALEAWGAHVMALVR
jgi:integrase